ncbi:MAG TPA: hypothetical protein VNU01_04865, partial [Egibacteraceae bacterium]|nr:hypothetical protein [Egibacteraceae bacterium]
CGGGAAGEPKDQLVEALRAMGQDAGVTVQVSLDTDEASLAALNAAGDEPMPPELVALVSQAWMRVSLPFDPEAKTAEVSLGKAADQLLAFRVIGDDVYVQADVAALVDAAGQDPAVLDGARAMLTETGVLPPDVLDGRWVVLRGATQLAEELSGQEVANPLDQMRAREAMQRLGRTLAEEAAITRVGQDAQGDHLRAVLPLRRLYSVFLEEAEAMGLPTPSGEAPALEEVPDESVTVDVWVRDGRLSVVSLDLRQLAAMDPEAPEIPAEVERFALRAEFTPFDGVVDVPADAVELNPEALMGLFMGAMGGAMGPLMGGATMEGMPPGFDPSAMPPGMAPGAFDQPPPDMMAPEDHAMAGQEFYAQPGYAEARQDYCAQVADVPESQRRHYEDICP